MLEWTVEALKMYYVEILTHGLAMMIGFGLGLAAMGEVNEKAKHKSHGSKKRDKGREDGTDKEDGSKDGHQAERRE